MFFSDKSKNLLFYILVLIILLTFLGKPLIDTIQNYFIYLNNLLEDKIKEIVSTFGYTTGTIINSSSEIVSQSSKDGIDIINNAMEESSMKDITSKIKTFTNNGIDITNDSSHSLGNKLRNLNEDNLDINVKKSVNNNFNKFIKPVSDDMSGSSIQNNNSDGEKGWCLVNKYENGNKCVAINDHNKCMSGQIFPSQKMCINSSQTQ